jgi:hypothetical protein
LTELKKAFMDRSLFFTQVGPSPAIIPKKGVIFLGAAASNIILIQR